MRLSELNPRFVRREIRPCAGYGVDPECKTVSPHTEHEWRVDVGTIGEADGIYFLCPKCFVANGGPQGTHQVLCWRPRVPDGVAPGPGRWEFEGTGFEDLSLRAGSSSVLLTSGCCAHFLVVNGEIQPS